MKFKSIINTGELVRQFIRNNVLEGYKVLDCTIGNGHDTLALSQAVGSTGKVYGFDIQEIAIENTLALLKKHNSSNNVELILDSHENIDNHISHKLNFIIYNLGYLPKGDKSIRTSSTSSVISIKKALTLLDKNGLLAVTVYVGHPGGMDEKNSIEEIFKTLDQKEYNVLRYEFINQANDPPVFYCIERVY